MIDRDSLTDFLGPRTGASKLFTALGLGVFLYQTLFEYLQLVIITCQLCVGAQSEETLAATVVRQLTSRGIFFVYVVRWIAGSWAL